MTPDWFQAAEAAWQGRRLEDFEIPDHFSVLDIQTAIRHAALIHIQNGAPVTVLAILTSFPWLYSCVLARGTADTIADWRRS